PLGPRDPPVGLIRFGLHHVEADAVGVHLVVTPGTVDAGHRRVGRRHHQPDGSLGLPAVASGAVGAPARSWPGVRASRVSLTDSMVCFGPRMRRTFRYPNSASTAATTTMIPNTIRNAAHRHNQVSSSSARKKNRKNVE